MPPLLVQIAGWILILLAVVIPGGCFALFVWFVTERQAARRAKRRSPEERSRRFHKKVDAFMRRSLRRTRTR